MVRARSDVETVVEVIEDTHWMDDASIPFLKGLVQAVAGTRTLLILTYRTAHPAQWLAGEHVRELSLMPLNPVAAESQVRQLLGGEDAPVELVNAIQARGEGNPFFAEELVRNLMEERAGGAPGEAGAGRGTPVLKMPPSIENVLAARIDRLLPQEKMALQTLSVIGREFDSRVLEDVAAFPTDALDTALPALIEAGLIDPLGDTQYRFRHALTREVAYASLLSTERSRVHASVARTIIEADGGGSGEHAALIAHHLEMAGSIDQAATWSARAAEWVAGSHPATALSHWRSVCGLTDQLEPDQQVVTLALTARLRSLALSWRLGEDEAEVAERFARARDIAQATHALGAEALLVANYATVRGFAGHGREFLALAEEAVELAARSDDLGILQTTRAAHQLALSHRGRLRDALEVSCRIRADALENPQAGAGLALVFSARLE
ncbi:MAG: ATP-binding protein [Solirubrobacteraceae bacterium]